MLSTPWQSRQSHYNFIVVGSGYGGAISAARLANANISPKPTVCILERGREWPVGSFPDSFEGLLENARSDTNPLGLYEFLTYSDISVFKGSGLGGTSLVNANVAIVPDEDVFRSTGWPASLDYAALAPYYERARKTLAAGPHPRALELKKVQALNRRAEELGTNALPLNITVNFIVDGVNEHGAKQHPCIDCGDCVTGCNVGAKNTLAMNYLPAAARGGAQMFTQTKVEWIEKLVGSGWRIHGRYVHSAGKDEKFTLTADNVIMAAGSINTTEILLRSEMHGLRVSPRLGTGFSGKGDFFGIAYNGNYRTDVLGFGNHPDSDWRPYAPGPSIVSAIRYRNVLGEHNQMYIQDLSFPAGYAEAARVAFTLLRGSDTDAGDDQAERERVLRDAIAGLPRHPDGALNHSMLYLCMGFDDARGAMIFEAPWYEPDGRVRIEWDDVGRQIVFTRINEELRRHARTQGASFMENPISAAFQIRHLISAHPLGGCPVGEDYHAGAVDQYGRVFAGDGSIHEGLFVADGALVPSPLGVNPFLTISALAERIAERKIEHLQGKAYPAPPVAAAASEIDPLEVMYYTEAELERLFQRTESGPITWMVNSGERSVDPATRLIRNDEYWKGFFPKRHILNTMSSALFIGFRKRFFKEGERFGGVTSDADTRIKARNSLEEITLKGRERDLAPGRYIVLRYLDSPWQGHYDIFKVVNQNLLVGRAYFGSFPNGHRLFTFPMSRIYGFQSMTVDDHGRLWDRGQAPSPEQLNGVWQMQVISNANSMSEVASLEFAKTPDGRMEARYQLLGLMERLVIPSFITDHFRLNDFTPFYDEIRVIDDDLMIGKYITEIPLALASIMPAFSIGLLHSEGPGANRRFGFHYVLIRSTAAPLPINRLLQPFVETRLPDRIGMTFDEEMVGWYREGDQALPADMRQPPGAVSCSFRLRMTVSDMNDFIEGPAHEAAAGGIIEFGKFDGFSPATIHIDSRRSTFQYLWVNAETHEAEMRYNLFFRGLDGRTFRTEGRKFMRKDRAAGPDAAAEVLADYTTLFHSVLEQQPDSTWTIVGTGVLKFRTFEDLAAVGNLAGFLRSLSVTGTDDPLLKVQAQMRFLGFTGQFVQREYDGLGLRVQTRGADEESALRMRVEQNPSDIVLGRQLVDLLRRRGRAEEAAHVLDLLIEGDPENHELVLEKAQIYREAGDERRYVETRAFAEQLRAERSFEANVGKATTVREFEMRDLPFFGNFKWQLQPGVNVLLGRNGHGKTHLLRALVGMLQNQKEVTGQFFSTRSAQGSRPMIRVEINREGELQTSIRSRIIFERDFGKVPVLAIPDMRYIEKSEDSFGPSTAMTDMRSQGGEAMMFERSFQGVILTFLYELCLDYDRNPTFDQPLFRIIQDTVQRLTDNTFNFEKIERLDNARFRILVATDGNESNPLPLQKVSQGTLSLLSMVGLIYRFLKSVRPQAPESSVAGQQAIVVIDEIDAHLHPAWQQQVLQNLRDIFPNVQLIVTAHSPLVVAGCKKYEVSVLRKRSDGFVVDVRSEHFIGATAESLYRKVFDIEDKDLTYLRLNTLQATKASLEAVIESLQERDRLTPEEKSRLDELEDQVFYLEEVRQIDEYSQQLATYDRNRQRIQMDAKNLLGNLDELRGNSNSPDQEIERLQVRLRELQAEVDAIQRSRDALEK